MARRVRGLAHWLSFLVLAVAVAVAVPAAAQSTGIVRGTVTDASGQPVEGAKVTIEMNGGTGRRFETKTDKKGEYLQVGLSSGSYKVAAEKGKLAAAPMTVSVRVNQRAQANLVLGAAGAPMSKEAAAKATELKQLFDEGVALSTAGNHNEAIEKFTAAAALNERCNDCYDNIGFSYTQMKEYDKAEAAYKKAVEIKPDDATGYSGLATIYNAQRKFDLASEASAKATEYSSSLSAAGGAGAADAQYNQGVILWNGGKIAEAKKAFEAAVQANPDHAEAHYQLGMALVNEGNMAGAATEFETYLRLSPDGPNAATAKSLVAQLKK